MLRGSRGDAAGDRVGCLLRRAISSEHGNRPWSARGPRGQRGASGWAHRRPIGPGRGGAAVVLRGPGEPVTWGRAAAVFEKGWRLQCRKMRRRMVTPRPTTTHRRCAGGSAAAGIGDAGQASPLGGGRSWPPVRRPVQPRARPGDADRGVGPGRGQPRGPTAGVGRVDGRRGSKREVGVPGFLDDLRTQLKAGHVSAAAGAGTQDPQAGRVGKGAAARDSRRWPTGSSRRR